MIIFGWKKKKPLPRLMQLGKMVFVDPDTIDAIYMEETVDKSQRLILRMDGLGIIRLKRSDLFQDFGYTINELTQRINKL